MLTVIAVTASACSSARSAAPVLLPVNAEPSAIYDMHGTLITTLREENRSSVPLERIPSVLQDAVVAIEDARFWEHKGVDPRAVARAASSNAASGEVSQGGSTITQQYVKLAILTPEQTLGRKLEEASLALALERNYSKELILELYLNTIYLGNGAYGVQAASQSYFGIPVEQLRVDQAAMLAGIIQAPSRNNPRTDPDSALKRRNLVLKRMRDQQYITATQYEAAVATPVELVELQAQTEQAAYAAPHFVDAVKDWLLNDSDALGKTPGARREALLRGGLSITTTIDLNLQNQAETSIAEVLPGQGVDPKIPDAALVSIEPGTGFVRAMVGGYNYFGTHSYRQSNLAMGSGRQTGSTFKPIVMATALDAGVSPSKQFASPSNARFNIPGGVWSVKGGAGLGSGTMRDCAVVSSNTCFANVIQDPAVGPEKTNEMAKKLGIVSTKLVATPAMVLGPNNTTVEDMADVYATFANAGVRVPPTVVTKITGPDGSVIYQHAHSQSKAIEPAVAAQVSTALRGVITGGTGTSANIGREAAGKTGSAQNNTDAWFCGYVPQLATAVWVGFAEPRANKSGQRSLVSMTSPNTRITVFGGTYPARIWASFMKGALADTPELPLIAPVPPEVTTTTVAAPNASVLAPVPANSFVEVPDLEGMALSAAKSALEKLGLSSESVTVFSATEAAGSVTAQSPRPGSKLRAGSSVWIESIAPPTTTTTTTTTIPAASTTTVAGEGKPSSPSTTRVSPRD
ncbi:membrane carboxypeptidase (penicillin-binding protein) [Actinobacteria bacterium IMCC26207]|nr:membrane carboxypeptidase (penicillin-binding protein) [Actinobacteria bacterium IMCC26207]